MLKNKVHTAFLFWGQGSISFTTLSGVESRMLTPGSIDEWLKLSRRWVNRQSRLLMLTPTSMSGGGGGGGGGRITGKVIVAKLEISFA